MIGNAARFLVLGASGFVGQEFLQLLGPERAVGTYSHHPFSGGVAFDGTRQRVRDLLRSLGRPLTHGLILMARAKIDECAQDPQGTYALNVRAAIQAIDDFQSAGIVPIFASTDFVFDGREGYYLDAAPTCPSTTYGRHKAAVEAYCGDRPDPCLVLRFSKIVGLSSASHSLIGEWLRAIGQHAPVLCARDQKISPAGVEDLVKGIRDAAELGLTGIYNSGGVEPLSRLELIQILERHLRAAGLDAPNYRPCSIRDFPFAESRPLDTSLDSSALYDALGYRFRDMDSYCEEAVRLYSLQQHPQPKVEGTTPR